MDKNPKLVRAAARGMSIVLGMMATGAAAAFGIALAIHVYRGAIEPQPRPESVPLPVPVALAAPVSPSVGAEPAHEATTRPAPKVREVRHAVKAFCESSARLERRYYDEKPKTTKARACRDMRDQLRHRHRLDIPGDTVEDNALTVSFDDKRDLATYWEVSLRRAGASWSVTSVDYLEDCTGP